MPEAPEVRIFRDQLDEKARGHWLRDVSILGGRFKRFPPDNFQEFKKLLPAKVLHVKCKGKFLWFEFDNGWHLFNTLAMTGSWTDHEQKHSAIGLQFSPPFLEDKFSLYFTDPRHFGTVKFGLGDDLLMRWPRGWDILNALLSKQKPDKKTFASILRGVDRNVTEALMDQSLFAGIGNYIKSETLYRACISPWRSTSTLTQAECYTLFDAVCAVLTESYKAGGATLATYKSFSGAGSFGEQLQVYKKKVDPHLRSVKKETTSDKRTTWWVPEIQK